MTQPADNPGVGDLSHDEALTTLPMQPRLLIINCASPYFFYIPMGSFGLCDYLGQQGIETLIFNPALYGEHQAQQRLQETLAHFQPSHVGLVLHWQETAHGLLAALKTVRQHCPQAVTLCGGFTASYFAEDLLKSVPELDYVVTGDPEEPVRQLLQGHDPALVANLIRRQNGAVVRNNHSWLIDQPLLDSLSFADLDRLIDADLYLEKINSKLGFPLFLGRGCVFDCEYCGGSRHAFRRHSGRQMPVCRSLESVLADLRSLRGKTKLLYLCYENDPGYIKDLFRAIAVDPSLQGHFCLHYGAWHLLDEEFLQLYLAAFDCTSVRPIIEFSPEVYSDLHRASIKRGRTYTLKRLEENIVDIGRVLNGRVRIEVFFSRYHPAVPEAALMEEVSGIVLLKHRMFRAGSSWVRICWDHLSTDVGSRYWDSHVDKATCFATLLHLKQKVDQGTLYPFPVDNLCLHIPSHLSADAVLRLEVLLFALEQLERHCIELFHLLCASLADQWLRPLAGVLEAVLAEISLEQFFADPPLQQLVHNLGLRLQEEALESTPALLADLVRFSCRKLECAMHPAAVPGCNPAKRTCWCLTGNG